MWRLKFVLQLFNFGGKLQEAADQKNLMPPAGRRNGSHIAKATLKRRAKVHEE